MAEPAPSAAASAPHAGACKLMKCRCGTPFHSVTQTTGNSQDLDRPGRVFTSWNLCQMHKSQNSTPELELSCPWSEVVRELYTENVWNLVGVEMVPAQRQPTENAMCICGEGWQPFLGPRLLQQLRPGLLHVWCTKTSAQYKRAFAGV